MGIGSVEMDLIGSLEVYLGLVILTHLEVRSEYGRYGGQGVQRTFKEGLKVRHGNLHHGAIIIHDNPVRCCQRGACSRSAPIDDVQFGSGGRYRSAADQELVLHDVNNGTTCCQQLVSRGIP
jgi:hypothetical protein